MFNFALFIFLESAAHFISVMFFLFDTSVQLLYWQKIHSLPFQTHFSLQTGKPGVVWMCTLHTDWPEPGADMWPVRGRAQQAACSQRAGLFRFPDWSCTARRDDPTPGCPPDLLPHTAAPPSSSSDWGQADITLFKKESLQIPSSHMFIQVILLLLCGPDKKI